MEDVTTLEWVLFVLVSISVNAMAATVLYDLISSYQQNKFLQMFGSFIVMIMITLQIFLFSLMPFREIVS